VLGPKESLKYSIIIDLVSSGNIQLNRPADTIRRKPPESPYSANLVPSEIMVHPRTAYDEGHERILERDVRVGVAFGRNAAEALGATTQT